MLVTPLFRVFFASNRFVLFGLQQKGDGVGGQDPGGTDGEDLRQIRPGASPTLGRSFGCTNEIGRVSTELLFTSAANLSAIEAR
jgi:hypothetical protein